jgi:hypothetical protein
LYSRLAVSCCKLGIHLINLDIFDMDLIYFVMDLAKLEAKVVADVTRLFWVSLLFRWQDSQLAE